MHGHALFLQYQVYCTHTLPCRSGQLFYGESRALQKNVKYGKALPCQSQYPGLWIYPGDIFKILEAEVDIGDGFTIKIEDTSQSEEG